ncbi:hypothetical protein D6D01_09703 [Aureobasidium pullulans]|uniref:BTB domain-containing protein n=1 Tax=Aureobasidium pullulans TaxID=5580 RepID=A0A4S9JY40_AURPU|nr:hypothetical protein D6D01_09703 [Aureobasidium pullulans]
MAQPRNYFNNKSFSDVMIKFGRHEVHADRVILAGCSAQFEKEMIIDPETDMAVINLKATHDAKAIYVMLKHCYGIAWETPSTPAYLYDFNFVLTVYNVADTYGISDLYQKARGKFCSMVSDFFLQWLCDLIPKTTANCFIWTLSRVLGPFAGEDCTALQEEVFGTLFENKEFVQLFARGLFFDLTYAVRFAQRIRDKLVAREWDPNWTDRYDSWDDDASHSVESSSESGSVAEISTAEEV